MRLFSICLISLLLLSLNGFSQQSGWILQNSGTLANLNSVYFTSPTTGWVAGSIFDDFADWDVTRIGVTYNRGTNWIFQSSGFGVLESIHALGDGTGLAVGWWSHVQESVILKLSNNSWLRISDSLDLQGCLNSVYFTNSNTGWAVGDNGMILHSLDGGVHWIAQDNPLSDRLTSVYFINDSTGWGVGDFDRILYTSDGGINWIFQDSDQTSSLASVYFVNDSTGWAVGDRILHTIDGGKIWRSQSGMSGYLSVHFPNDTTGWAVGYNGSILHTSNGGNDWNPQNSMTSNHLRSVSFVNENSGWAVGDLGTILHTSTGGVVSIDEELPFSQQIPSVFKLNQNYPNPFNPGTTIEFAIPQKEFVLLTVYNVLGEKIAILISENLTSGFYKYQWDTSRLASGVYIYRIEAGDFVKSQKMLLIR